MKQIFTYVLLTVVVASLITACSGKLSKDEKTLSVSYEDTVGFAQFQSWKAQNERQDASAYQQAPVAQQTTQSSRAATPVKRSYAHNGTSAPSTKASTKKGWSKAAKGTAIGAGSGAILGAVIAKNNRGLGAVIGGVVGGGVGYGIGRGMDRRDGRVN